MEPMHPGARAPLRVDSQVGGGRYLLQRKLGEGGMGSVWVAWDREVGKHYALKFLADGVTGDLEHWVRLRQEILHAQELRNEHIVGFFDLVVSPGEAPFLKMEYVAGRNLDEIRREQPGGVLSWEWLGPLMSQLCDALQHAHERGIIHCDIKPSNLMVDGFGRVKLADFGIAQVATSGAGEAEGRVFGTKAYMSPQRLSRRVAEVSDDLYALGATIYELLTGEPPFAGEDISARILGETPEPISDRLRRLGVNNEVPVKVRQVIARCLDKESASRPASARDLARALSPLAGIPAPRHAKTFLPPKPAPPIVQVEPRVESDTGARGGTWGRVVTGLALAAALLTAGAWLLWERSPVVSVVADTTNNLETSVADPEHAGSLVSNPKDPTDPVTPAPAEPDGTLQISAWDTRRTLGFDKTQFEIRIMLDGQEVRQRSMKHGTAWVQDLAPGDYVVVVAMRRDAGDAWADETELSRRVRVTSQGMAEVRFAYGFRELLVNVPDVDEAQVLVRMGGSYKPGLAGVPRKVVPGKKRIQVMAPGYRTVETDVLVPDDGPARYVAEVALTRDPTPQLRQTWLRPDRGQSGWAPGPFVWLGLTNASVWICTHELTVGGFAPFAASRSLTNGMSVMTAGGWVFREDKNWRDPGFPTGDDHPLVGVNWHEALEYCAWLTAKDLADGLLTPRHRYRLPRAVEFETAAMTMKPVSDWDNLAGEEVLGTEVWNPRWQEWKGHRDPYVWTAPVTRWDMGPLAGSAGCRDLMGNVAEWCEDLFHPSMNEGLGLEAGSYHLRPPPQGTYRVVKGGSWFDADRDDANPRVSGRALPDSRRNTIGFRMVLEERSDQENGNPAP